MLEKYSDIIYLTQHRIPNYQEIYFDKYLEKVFPDKATFITNFDLNEIRKQLVKIYGNSNDCFKNKGLLVDVTLQNLKYYQKGVGINEPKYNKLDSPIYVISIDNIEILYDGYHRTLHSMINNVFTLKAYKLTLDLSIANNL